MHSCCCFEVGILPHQWILIFEQTCKRCKSTLLLSPQLSTQKYFFNRLSLFFSSRQYRGSYRLRIFEKPDFSGHMMEFMDDCPCVSDRFHHRHVYSCNVMNGYWIFYEYPNYRGRQYFLRAGEYRRYRDWCATCAIVGSFRRVTEF